MSTIDMSKIDVISNEAYRNGPPYEQYDLLRREAPVVRHAGMEPGFPDWFWGIFRHDDIVTVSRQFQTYSSARQGSLMQQDRPDLEAARMMIDTDPPDHTRLRTLVNRGFTPKAMRALEDHFREVAVQLVAEAVKQKDVEFVEKVSAELPLVAIAELLGIPVEERHKVFEWSNRMIGSTDPDYSGGADDAANAAAELYMYAQSLAEDRRKNPRADIITTLIDETADDHLGSHEFELFVLLLSVAGNETTRNGISHGVLALIENPSSFEELRAEPELVPGAVEEILRWATPVNNFRRTATCDVELHGVQIKEGDAVVMFYPSGNRDEAVFKDPYTFDIRRNPNPHLTFGGGGPHFCLGSNLARLEMRIVFEELARQVKGIELTGDVSRLRSHFVHGIKTLPVRLHS